jgi:hypothetical protein
MKGDGAYEGDRSKMSDTVTFAITLPVNGNVYETLNAITLATNQATMRGDGISAGILSRLGGWVAMAAAPAPIEDSFERIEIIRGPIDLL